MALRRVGALLAALLAALAFLGLTAGPASAHAALLKTTPADGEIAATSPSEVTLTFSEPVGTGLGAIQVLSASGDRGDSGTVSRSDGDTVVHVPLRASLAEGSYAVVWRVLSADSHPVSGSFVFSVGAKTDIRGYQGRITAPRSPSTLLGLTRGLGFAALLVLLGGGVFCLLLWPGAAGHRAVRRVLVLAAATELVSAAAALALQGPYAAGLGVSHLLDRSLLDQVMQTQYGDATAARVAIAAAAVLVALLLRRLPSRAGAGLLVVLGAGAAATWSAAGHAGTDEHQPLAYLDDLLHLLAVSAWIGGLTLLGVALRGRWTAAEASARLPRWSRIAMVSVLVLTATGVYASWRQVGSIPALTGTAYGRLLVVKTTLVLLMLLFAALGRAFVRRHYGAHGAAGPSEEQAGELRRTTLVETVLAGVVVLVTAVLVQTPPAASAYAPPYTGVSAAGSYRVQVDLYPARKGINGLHIYTLGPNGRTVDVAEITGSIWERGGAAIAVHPVRKSLGHYEDLKVIVPGTGRYVITLQVRVGELDSYPTSQTITIR